MTQEQLDYIVMNSEWNDEKKEWAIPYFSYKEKNMGLPKLGNTIQRKESSEMDKTKKEVIFKTQSSRDMERSSN